jgi:hypothetical protein
MTLEQTLEQATDLLKIDHKLDQVDALIQGLHLPSAAKRRLATKLYQLYADLEQELEQPQDLVK